MNHGEAIKRLFSAFERGTSPERAVAYLEAVSTVNVDRLAGAVDWFVRHWDKPTPPSIAKLLERVAQRTATGDTTEQSHCDAMIKRLLPRLCDLDYWPFFDAYGVEPDQGLYSQHDIPPPEGMTFCVPSREECEGAHRAEIARVNSAVHETYGIDVLPVGQFAP